MNIKNLVNDIYEEMITIRRHLHAHPELSEKEFETQAYIRDFLTSNNIENEISATTGVVGTIGHQGPCIGIRADIDALPIQEATGVSYASNNKGVMHACGHDVHTTILLGTAKILKSIEKELNVQVKLLFEPAEETIGGAYYMEKEGVLKDVDYVIGLHVMPYLKNGQIEVKYGQMNAASDTIELTIQGKSSHGAYPDKGVDAIFVAADLIQSLQSLVSRKTSPLDPVVLTFGAIQGGSKPNIICDEVQLKGTLRTLNKTTRLFCKDQIENMVEGLTKAHGATYELKIHEGYEALINHDPLVKHVVNTLSDDFDILYKEHPSLGVESFSYFSNKVPGAFYHLGCSDGQSDALHQCNFNIDETCIKSGILSQLKIILDIDRLNN